MDYKAYFKDKKITVMGLGVLGRGVGDVEFLAKCGADLIVTDLKKAEDLQSSLDRLSGFSNITYRLGEHKLEDFKDRDMILKSAGVPLGSEFINEARKNEISIEMSASLFLKLSGIKALGVTGTRGKSTTTYLIHHVLEKWFEDGEGKKTFNKLILGGNILGVSNLAFLETVKENDLAVLELDSWQLQGFGDSEISPHVAVFTNFMTDHMNYYRSTSLTASMERYFLDKANIYKYQTENDFLVAGRDISEKVSNANAKILTPHGKTKDWATKLLGEHNREYIELAVLATGCLGVPEDIQKKAVADFPGVPGRLEFIAEKNSVLFYNDTTATIPEATMVAVKSLKEETFKKDEKNSGIILISGGNDKNLNYEEYAEVIPSLVKKIIFLPGTGTDKIKGFLSDGVNYIEAKSMKEAVEQAVSFSSAGDIVLLSPGATSFGLFKNEYDRGDQFVNEVKSL